MNKAQIQIFGITILAVGLGLSSARAAEPDTGPYLGIGVGRTKTKMASVLPGLRAYVRAVLGGADWDVGGATCSSTVQDTSTGLKLFGGYRFNRHVSVEGFYTDLGTFSSDAALIASASEHFFVAADKDVRGLGAAIVGAWPLSDKVSLLGKAGFFRWDLDLTTRLTAPPGYDPFSTPERQSASGTSPMYGLGVEFAVFMGFALRAEVERYSRIGNNDTGKQDVDMLSVAALYKF